MQATYSSGGTLRCLEHTRDPLSELRLTSRSRPSRIGRIADSSTMSLLACRVGAPRATTVQSQLIEAPYYESAAVPRKTSCADT